MRKLRATFDNGNVDFSTPEGYERDIHAVAAMIKVVEHAFASTHLIPLSQVHVPPPHLPKDLSA